MDRWFTVDQVDRETYVISEYRHWEEPHCYLLNGAQRSLLIDTGLGICNISEIVAGLTDKPVTAIATHIHWDHIGGHKYYPDFYAHRAEVEWLHGGFPQPLSAVKKSVVEHCELPGDFSIDNYELFQGRPVKILCGGEHISLGDRDIQVIHTPGHSPGHMCFWEEERGYLFTGDLVYKGMLAAWFPTTDPVAYGQSLEKVSLLPVKRVFPGHHTLAVEPEILLRMRDGFRQLKATGKLFHGSGTFPYEDWSVRL